MREETICKRMAKAHDSLVKATMSLKWIMLEVPITPEQLDIIEDTLVAISRVDGIFISYLSDRLESMKGSV